MPQEDKESGSGENSGEEQQREPGRTGEPQGGEKKRSRGGRGRGRSSKRAGTKARTEASSRLPGVPTPEADATNQQATTGASGGRKSSGEGRQGSSRATGKEELQAKAWQLFVVEVAEEGVRMMDADEAKGLAELCFDLAESFLKVQKRKGR